MVNYREIVVQIKHCIHIEVNPEGYSEHNSLSFF